MKQVLKQMSFRVRNNLNTIVTIADFDYKTKNWSPTWSKTGNFSSLTISDYACEEYYCKYCDNESNCSLTVSFSEIPIESDWLIVDVAISYENNFGCDKQEIDNIKTFILQDLYLKVVENFATIRVDVDAVENKIIDIKFKKLNPKAIPFSYTRKNDACMDMYALDDAILAPGETRIVYTGIAVEIPAGYEGIVRGRSGLASQGIFVHVGTVDFEYRGSLGIIMSNLTKEDFHIQHGMRLGQFTVKPVFRCNLIQAKELSETERGANGYGSSQL